MVSDESRPISCSADRMENSNIDIQADRMNRGRMPLFVALCKFTDAGTKSLSKDFEEQLEKADAVVSKMGGKVVARYHTLGAYDIVAVAELPDMKTALRCSARIASGGLVRIQTLPAISDEEFVELTKAM